jgi:hypothetical protein
MRMDLSALEAVTRYKPSLQPADTSPLRDEDKVGINYDASKYKLFLLEDGEKKIQGRPVNALLLECERSTQDKFL